MADKIDTIQKRVDKEIYLTTLGDSNDEVVIGDEANPSTFKNKITFTKWNKENSLSIDFSSVADGDDFVDVDGKTKVKKDNKTKFYYDRTNDNVIKFGLILPEVPDASLIVTIDGEQCYHWQFSLGGDWQDFEFNYQPPLTEEWKIGDKRGLIVKVTETQCLGADGFVWVYRPIDVVGGYTVKHKTKFNHEIGKTNYRNGKIAQIYRPRIINSDGDFICWAKIRIIEGVYHLYAPITIAHAKYPVKFNDTFGYSGDPDSYEWFSSDYVDCGYSFSPSTSGTLTKLTFYNYGGNPFVGRAVVYKTSDNTLVAVSGEVTSYGTWTDFTLNNESIVSGTNYMLGVWAKNAYGWPYDSGTHYVSDGSQTYHATNNPASPITWDGGKPYATNRDSSIYATYTPSGGGGLPLNTAKCYVSML